MFGSNINKFLKMEKNKKVNPGPCIFPFKYKYKTHTSCFTTEKGEICATSVNDRNTLQTYGYCEKRENVKKNTQKRTKQINKQLNKTIKLKNPIKGSTKKTSMSYNKEFIDSLGKLYDLMMATGQPFRARAYKNAQNSIISYKEPIITIEQIKTLPSIGVTILSKLEEYMTTGKIQTIEKYENDPMILFTKVFGIGSKKAKELVKKENITTIQELKIRANEVLNDKQKIGLEYFEPLQEKIPRKEIDKYYKILEQNFNAIKKDGEEFMIVGSYRREKEISGDIDIIITSKQNNNSIFNDFIDRLINKKIVVDVLSRGNKKSLAISRIKSSIPRRIDFLYAPPEEYSFAILYFTGSALFNTVMRQHALELGYTMNEHGLYKMENKVKTDKIDIIFPDEKSIFDFLGLVYKEPKHRIDAKSLEIKPKLKDVAKEQTTKKAPKNKTFKKNRTSIKTYLHSFQKSGFDFIEMLSENMIVTMLEEANKQYYNETPILTDNEFDILKEFIEKKFPKNVEVKQIGAPIEKNKANLPYFMGSMDKIKPDTGYLKIWKKTYNGPYVLSAKLDGVSGLYTTENGEKKLYTRGNGVVGQDVSHLIPYLQLPEDDNITIRGEFIMTKQIFEEIYAKTFANSRNFVSGVINSKKIDDKKIRHIDFVAYEVIQPLLTPSEQMKYLESLEVKTVINELLEPKKLTNEYLSDLLISYRDSYSYTIDGVIVTDDKNYPRKNKNPKHSFAFKMVLSDQIAEAKVLDVLWTPSKYGYLKPRIRIEPITIGGATIEYATAFNGAYVKNNKIGIGSMIRLIRSGDVIPHILETIVQASVAKMPDVPYKWNESHIDIILLDALNNEIVKTKNITNFYNGLDVVGLGEGNVKRLMKAGFDSVAKIIAMTQSDFLKVEGFKEKLANKIHKNIHDALDTMSLEKLMAVSNVFGRGMGERRISEILKNYPNVLISKETMQEKINKISQFKGFAEKTALTFVENIDRFLDFIVETKLNIDLILDNVKCCKKDGKLSNHIFVFSGFRNKSLEDKIILHGGKVSNCLSKNTKALVVKDTIDETTKTEKAKKLNVPILNVVEFTKKYIGDE